MPMKIVSHIQAAGQRLHVPFKHRIHTVATGMPPADKQLSPFLLEYAYSVMGFPGQMGIGKFQKGTKAPPIRHIALGSVDMPMGTAPANRNSANPNARAVCAILCPH